MSSVDVVLALCKKRKIAVYRVEHDLGYGNGYFKKLKKGEIPATRVGELAEYFGVTVEYLIGATPESALLGTEYALTEAEKAYAKAKDAERRDELGAYIDYLRDSLEDLQIAVSVKRKKPATDDGDGLEVSDDSVRAEINELYDSLDASDRARLLAFAQGLKLSQGPRGEDRG